MIYSIPNPNLQTVNYVCLDQATIDAGKTLGYQGIYVIGLEADAKNLQNQIQQDWLNSNALLFSVNKDIDTDPVQTTWIACDLENETVNNDVDYNIFDVLNGYYKLITGLDAAKQLLESTKQTTANTFIPLDFFEQWHKPNKEAISIGLQTI
jgi:hypothetical protein